MEGQSSRWPERETNKWFRPQVLDLLKRKATRFYRSKFRGGRGGDADAVSRAALAIHPLLRPQPPAAHDVAAADDADDGDDAK